jgi:hypothetical protein
MLFAPVIIISPFITSYSTHNESPVIKEIMSHFETSSVFLEPPSPGKHDLRLSTSVLNPTTPSYNYAAEVVYHLDIK